MLFKITTAFKECRCPESLDIAQSLPVFWANMLMSPIFQLSTMMTSVVGLMLGEKMGAEEN